MPKLNSRAYYQYPTAELIRQGLRENQRLLSYLLIAFRHDSVSRKVSRPRDSDPSSRSVRTSKRLAPVLATAPADRGIAHPRSKTSVWSSIIPPSSGEIISCGQRFFQFPDLIVRKVGFNRGTKAKAGKPAEEIVVSELQRDGGFPGPP